MIRHKDTERNRNRCNYVRCSKPFDGNIKRMTVVREP